MACDRVVRGMFLTRRINHHHGGAEDHERAAAKAVLHIQRLSLVYNAQKKTGD